ncbi:MAG: Co2+/Mg2+ efflux protein ApaG [Bacteroidia bacterium]|nr:Co2+/Mg2+ efflux protein ApaG [Bacteroidia bacterium]
MQVAITHDVKIMVETSYQSNKSGGENGKHMFAYRITIENQGEHTIKLLRRHWYIVDSLDGKSEVEGEGVVGVQPLLEPEEKYQYVSGCMLSSELGKMHGTYLMERQIDGKLFEVKIPEFILCTPYILN